MLIRNVYINGISGVSAQPTFDETFLYGSITEPSAVYKKIIEPDYKQFLNPAASRRFSRLIKMSLVAAQKSIAMAGGVMPEAIITGTGLGCQEDTEKFLLALIENNESMLSPTAFIQSTHNTIGGQIAMMLTCYHPNYTYANRYFSFESSLLDGILMLEDHSCKHILINAADEVIASVHSIAKRMGLWDRNECIQQQPQMPVTVGEGAMSMVISSEKKETSLAKINAFKLFYKLPAESSVEEQLKLFLQEASLSVSDIEMIILGMNGDPSNDCYYEPVRSMFADSTQLVYKHLFGESFTSSSFAYWLGAQIIRTKRIQPSWILSGESNHAPKHILVYNQFRGKYHSFCLLTDVEL